MKYLALFILLLYGGVLVAQEEARPKIMLGLGLDIASTLLSEAGKERFDGLSKEGFDDQVFLSVGAIIPFVMTFKVVKPYRMGFGAYLSVAYQTAKVKLAKESPERGVDAILYERGMSSLALVLFNELALSKTLSINLSVGPSFTLSFGDKSTKTQNGIEVPDPFTSFTRQDSLQYSFGLLVNVGLQIRLNYLVGVGFDAHLLMFFTPQPAAFDANTWFADSTYAGTLGGSVSLLLFL